MWLISSLFMVVYLLEIMLMRTVDCILHPILKLGKKEDAEQSKTKVFSKIYCSHVTYGHFECIFFRARGAMTPLVPPRSTSGNDS